MNRKPQAFASLLLLMTGVLPLCGQVCAPVPPNMVSWWRAEGNANDSIDGNNGTLSGAVTFGPGEVGQAFSFSGGEVDVPHNANQNTGAQISIDAWIFPKSAGHGRPIMNKRTTSNVGGYTFETTHTPFGPPNGLQFVIWISGNPVVLQTPPNVITINAWQHVAATYDGSTMRIYVNGVDVAGQAQTGSIDASNQPLVIGNNIVFPGVDAFDGLIDEIELFNRSLTAAEVQSIYAAGPAGKCFPDAFQVGYAANLSRGDSSINITNTGSKRGNDICVNVYAFDPSEELVACCACLVTPNALASLSAQADLISNTLSPSTPQAIVIKLLASDAGGGSCDPAKVTFENLVPGLRAWGTTLHALPGASATYGLTENDFLNGGLSQAELTHLTSFCGFAEANGSGFGICKSCRAGGLGGAKQ